MNLRTKSRHWQGQGFLSTLQTIGHPIDGQKSIAASLKEILSDEILQLHATVLKFIESTSNECELSSHTIECFFREKLNLKKNSS